MHKKIARILKKIGSTACLEKAKTLENESYQPNTLHLRNLGLGSNDISAIATILEQEKDTTDLKSISFSYNKQMGDLGATALAKSLPASLQEIGLVGCGIRDKGGRAILKCLKTAPHLKMICMEQNDFSNELKKEFEMFKKNNPQILVVL